MRKHLYVVYMSRGGLNAAYPYYFETAKEANSFCNLFSQTSVPRRTTSTLSKAEKLLNETQERLTYEWRELA